MAEELNTTLAGAPLSALERLEAQTLLMRIELGLSPIHDLRLAVSVLFNEGREAFEKLRGPPCPHAHEWKPCQMK